MNRPSTRLRYTGVIVMFLFASLMQLHAQENVKWYSFEEAVELNKQNPKKIFIDVYTDWCGWCKKMDKATFSHPVIASYMNENYYSVKFDAETHDTISFNGRRFFNAPTSGRRSSHQLAVAMLRGNMSYPSYVFMNEKNQFITVVNGYIPPDQFEPIINFFGDDAYLTTKWEIYQLNFKSNMDEPAP